MQLSGISRPSNKKEWYKKLKKRNRRKKNMSKHLKKERRDSHLQSKDEYINAFYAPLKSISFKEFFNSTNKVYLNCNDFLDT